MPVGSLIWPLVGAAAVTAADQVVKLAVLSAQPHVTVIPGFFAIRFTTNTGAAFSLSQQFPRALTVLGILILAIFIGYLWQRATTTSRLEQAAVSFLMGGALGNLIDRLRLGYVVDYLDVFVDVYHWPTFNLADSAIVIGVVCLALACIRGGGARQLSSARKPDQDQNPGLRLLRFKATVAARPLALAGGLVLSLGAVSGPLAYAIILASVPAAGETTASPPPYLTVYRRSVWGRIRQGGKCSRRMPTPLRESSLEEPVGISSFIMGRSTSLRRDVRGSRSSCQVRMADGRLLSK